jgi:hypothetical protein
MRRWTYVIVLTTVCAVAIATGARVHAQAKPPETVMLTGNPMGPVKFEHAKHSASYGAKCTDCHHASKPEKPMKAEQQKCSDCHTKVAAPPMKTKYMNAFHDVTAKTGTCMNCHVKSAAAGKKTPKVCTDCHKKENIK